MPPGGWGEGAASDQRALTRPLTMQDQTGFWSGNTKTSVEPLEKSENGLDRRGLQGIAVEVLR